VGNAHSARRHLYFNVDTYRAMADSFDTSQVDRLVWAPEAFGSSAF
jgi:hypothetical protein